MAEAITRREKAMQDAEPFETFAWMELYAQRRLGGKTAGWKEALQHDKYNKERGRVAKRKA